MLPRHRSRRGKLSGSEVATARRATYAPVVGAASASATAATATITTAFSALVVVAAAADVSSVSVVVPLEGVVVRGLARLLLVVVEEVSPSNDRRRYEQHSLHPERGLQHFTEVLRAEAADKARRQPPERRQVAAVHGILVGLVVIFIITVTEW